MSAARSDASAGRDDPDGPSDNNVVRGLDSLEPGYATPDSCPQVSHQPSFAYQATTPSDWQDVVVPAVGQDWSRLADVMPDSSACSSEGSFRRSSVRSGVSGRSGGAGGACTSGTGGGGGRAERVHRGCAFDIAWGQLKLGHRIRPCAHYAHCPDDLRLLGRFFELAVLEDIHCDSVKLLLRTLKFLRLCDYSTEDICSVLAHASAYFSSVHTICGEQMDIREVGNVVATLMFLAHCFVQDETCPLHIWHQYLFRKYCPLKTLNAAVFRLMELLRFILRLPEADLEHRYDGFRRATQQHQWAGGAAGTLASAHSAAAAG